MVVKSLQSVLAMVVVVVGGLVIILTSHTFASIVSDVAMVMCVCGAPLLTWMVLRVVLELRRVPSWRPAGSRPFRLSAPPVPRSLPGDRPAIGTVRGELEGRKVAR